MDESVCVDHAASNILAGVSRRVFQIVAGLLLFFAALTPLGNCFDSWDKNQPPANDTEFQLTALSVFAGFVLVLPKLVRQLLIAVVRQYRTVRPSRLIVALYYSDWVMPEPTGSPPPIPLRI